MKWLIYGALVCIWLLVIALLSSQPYEQQSIQPLLRRFLTREQAIGLLPNWPLRYRGQWYSPASEPFVYMEFVFRKCAHLFVYAVLAAAAWLLAGLRWSNRWLCAAGALGLTAGVAFVDEWNQGMSGTRTSSLHDVGLDVVGGCVGIAVVALLRWYWKRRR